MARFAYFADRPDGSIYEWRDTSTQGARGVGLYIPTDEPTATGNALCGYVPGKGWLRITRKIVMKSYPSRHECDARCMFAKGKTMNCECACAGKNHGRGAFVCQQV